MLSKQSIRKDHTIYLNEKIIEKSEMIEISKEFNDKEEQRFRKMLQQGGKLTIQGNEFKIVKKEYKFRNSRGEYEAAARPHRNEDWE
jgi:hypothetical protein